MMKTKVPDAKGFDVVVWQKGKVSTVFCAAYSARGQEYLGRWIEGPIYRVVAYDMGAIHPKEFIESSPKDLRIGGMNPDTKSISLINPRLH